MFKYLFAAVVLCAAFTQASPAMGTGPCTCNECLQDYAYIFGTSCEILPDQEHYRCHCGNNFMCADASCQSCVNTPAPTPHHAATTPAPTAPCHCNECLQDYSDYFDNQCVVEPNGMDFHCVCAPPWVCNPADAHCRSCVMSSAPTAFPTSTPGNAKTSAPTSFPTATPGNACLVVEDQLCSNDAECCADDGLFFCWMGASGSAKPSGAKPSGAKPSGAKPSGAKPSGAKPSSSKPSSSKPSSSKPSGGASITAISGSSVSGAKPSGSDGSDSGDAGVSGSASASSGAKPSGSKPSGAKPSDGSDGSDGSDSGDIGAKPSGAKPSGAKPSGAKPSGAKPSGKPGKPGKPGNAQLGRCKQVNFCSLNPSSCAASAKPGKPSGKPSSGASSGASKTAGSNKAAGSQSTPKTTSAKNSATTKSTPKTTPAKNSATTKSTPKTTPTKNSATTKSTPKTTPAKAANQRPSKRGAEDAGAGSFEAVGAADEANSAAGAFGLSFKMIAIIAGAAFLSILIAVSAGVIICRRRRAQVAQKAAQAQAAAAGQPEVTPSAQLVRRLEAGDGQISA